MIPIIDRFIEKRVEKRVEERAGYADLLLAGLETLVAGTGESVLRTTALEIAARIWQGALGGARVNGTQLITPGDLALTGRTLIREGEIVFAIVADPSTMGVRLAPVAEFEVRRGWRYQCNIMEPPGRSVTRLLPQESVIHFTWAIDKREPWRGIGPMSSASIGARLAANAEARIADEAGGPVANILPIPRDGGAVALTQLRQDIANARGGAVLAESTTTGWDEGRSAGTQRDWAARRLGPNPPESFRLLYEDAIQQVTAACGIPNSLASVNFRTDGTALREDYRRFVMMQVEPLGVRMAAEVSRKLERSVSFDFRYLWAHDAQGRATAYKALREAGIGNDEARRILGMPSGPGGEPVSARTAGGGAGVP